MKIPLDDQARDLVFREARTFRTWQKRPVTDETLRELYDLLKWAPTSANTNPARFVFLRRPESKERLRQALAEGNVRSVMSAPVTVIIAYDLQFYEKLPKLASHNPKARDAYASAPEMVEVTARRNSSLQGAYLILAARSLGLDCGPMSGFDNNKVDALFFGGAEGCEGFNQEFFSAGRLKSNFICNLGYGDPAGLFPRAPRLDFEESCTLL